MGLDMYLYADEYVGGWRHGTSEERDRYTTILDVLNLRDLACEHSPSLTVRVTVAYWRKANAIHSWFVENVQDGVDECQPSEVTEDNLKELLAVSKQALAEYEGGNPDAAAELLTPKSGFFFGTTEVDTWYADTLRDTIAQIEPLLAREGEHYYIYRSSW